MGRALFLAALLAAAPAWAQTGGLRVEVTDAATRAPLAGAEVVLSSSTKQVGTTSALTDASGAVTFPVLRAGGGYAVEVRLAGRATVSLADLRVPAGGTTVLPVALFGELQESVEVGAAREGVDLADTRTSATFTGEFTELLPVYGRFYQTVLTLAPGVLDPDQDGNPNVFGARESDFRTQVGGVANTDPLTGGFLSYINLESVDALEVIPAGAGVEYGRAQGGFASIVQRQGSNDFDGVAGFLFGGDLLDGNGAGGGEAASFQRYQPFVQISGPILRDRLWYRLSHEWSVRDDPVNVGGHVAVSGQRQEMHSDQLTWQVTPRHKLALQLQSDPTHNDHVGLGFLVPAESTYTVERGGRTTSLTWTSPRSPRLFAEGIVAYQDHTEDVYPQVPGVRNDCGGFRRLSTIGRAHCTILQSGRVTGSWPVDSSDHRQRFTTRAQVTMSPDTVRVGHQIKAGFAVENERYFRDMVRGIEGSIDVTGEFMGFLEGDYYTTMRIPGATQSRSVGSGTSAYVEDQLSFGSRLTITAGARVDREEISSESKELFFPAQEQALYRQLIAEGVTIIEAMPRAFTGFDGGQDFRDGLGQILGTNDPPISVLLELASTWPRQRKLANLDIDNTTFSPRLAVAWDPFGTGKTKLAATAGRYYDKIFLSVPLLGSEPAVTGLVFNANANIRSPRWGLNSLQGGAENDRITVVDPGMRTPYQDELTLSLERELWSETSVKVSWVHRAFRDQLQDVDINHAPADAGRCLATFDLRHVPIAGSPGSGQTLIDGYTGQRYVDTDPGYGDGRIDDCLGQLVQTAAFPVRRFAHRPDGLPDLYPLNPVWAQVMLVTNANSADYSAAVLQLTRRFSRGWEMQGNYTWSRALGEAEQFDQLVGDDAARLGEERGFLGYDQRHVVKVAASLEAPRHWRLGTAVRWESGVPYSVLESVQSYYGSAPEYGIEFPQPLLRERYVSGKRNDQRNPAYWTFDVRAAREFPLDKGRTFGLTLEGFNLLNDDTLQIVNMRNNVATTVRRFGRRLQVGLRYAF